MSISHFDPTTDITPSRNLLPSRVAMLRCARLSTSRGSRRLASDTLGVRVVLPRSVETRRNVHGQHAEQKASEDMQNRMA
jgi:hypothetical protein